MKLRERMRRMRNEIPLQAMTLYLACRDKGTPWYAKAIAAATAAYAFSPIDLIPDLIPFLGQLDDLVIVPLGIALAWKLIPKDVLARCREEAGRRLATGTPKSRLAAVAVVLLWAVVLGLVAWRVVVGLHGRT
jgi:uncharacterized membrane protein YkvA (DUF1232 family)